MRDRRVATVRDQEIIVKTADQRILAVIDLVAVDAGELLLQKLLLQSVVIIEPRLRAPADVEGTGHVRRTPRHNLAKLRPVIHFFIFHLFHRRARDDQSVEVPAPQFVKSVIELLQVVAGGVRGFMCAHPHKGNIHLKRRVGDHAQQIQLRVLLLGHQIQDRNLQRTDILMNCPCLVDHEQIFLFENFSDRKVILNLNRHVLLPPAPGTPLRRESVFRAPVLFYFFRTSR